MRDYSTVVVLPAAPTVVYDAINDVRAWWSEEVDGDPTALGGEFTFHGHDEANTVQHRSQLHVTDLVPGELIVWHVRENWMSFVADQQEWRGTEIRFELASAGEGTELRFSHRGLVPSYECYEACSSAWSFFIGCSLRDLVTTGTGTPIRPAGQPA